MLITLHDSKTLLCRFPFAPAAVAQIKTLPAREYDRTTQGWLVPVRDFDRVIAIFGDDASVDADVWEAVYPTYVQRLAKALTFARNLAAMGAAVVARDGRIVAEGDGVTPVLQAEVDRRSALIRRLMDDGHRFDACVPQWPKDLWAVKEDEGHSESVDGEPANGDAALQRAYVRGIANARRQMIRDAERREQEREDRIRQAFRVEQMELGL